MVVIDSSVWIDWLVDGPTARQIGNLFDTPREIVVPTIVQLEVSKWLLRERTQQDAREFIGSTGQYRVITLGSSIALSAAGLHKRHKLATADAIICATALHMEADLLTCDAHFKDLPGVVFLDKTG